MNPPTPPTTEQKIAIPICPHCKKELAEIGIFTWALGHGIILALFCRDCKIPLQFTAMPNPTGPGNSPLIRA